jgi:hypothetical protein
MSTTFTLGSCDGSRPLANETVNPYNFFTHDTNKTYLGALESPHRLLNTSWVATKFIHIVVFHNEEKENPDDLTFYNVHVLVIMVISC